LQSGGLPAGEEAVGQLLQIAGAVLILTAFLLAQIGRLDQHAYPYLLLNVGGSALLAGLAAAQRQWGFILLEGAWALVSLWSIGRRLLARRQGRFSEARAADDR
jgi:hypothetical protein